MSTAPNTLIPASTTKRKFQESIIEQNSRMIKIKYDRLTGYYNDVRQMCIDLHKQKCQKIQNRNELLNQVGLNLNLEYKAWLEQEGKPELDEMLKFYVNKVMYDLATEHFNNHLIYQSGYAFRCDDAFECARTFCDSVLNRVDRLSKFEWKDKVNVNLKLHRMQLDKGKQFQPCLLFPIINPYYLQCVPILNAIIETQESNRWNVQNENAVSIKKLFIDYIPFRTACNLLYAVKFDKIYLDSMQLLWTIRLEQMNFCVSLLSLQQYLNPIRESTDKNSMVSIFSVYKQNNLSFDVYYEFVMDRRKLVFDPTAANGEFFHCRDLRLVNTIISDHATDINYTADEFRKRFPGKYQSLVDADFICADETEQYRLCYNRRSKGLYICRNNFYGKTYGSFEDSREFHLIHYFHLAKLLHIYRDTILPKFLCNRTNDKSECVSTMYVKLFHKMDQPSIRDVVDLFVPANSWYCDGIVDDGYDTDDSDYVDTSTDAGDRGSSFPQQRQYGDHPDEKNNNCPFFMESSSSDQLLQVVTSFVVLHRENPNEIGNLYNWFEKIQFEGVDCLFDLSLVTHVFSKDSTHQFHYLDERYGYEFYNEEDRDTADQLNLKLRKNIRVFDMYLLPLFDQLITDAILCPILAYCELHNNGSLMPTPLIQMICGYLSPF